MEENKNENDKPLIISYNLDNLALILQKCDNIWNIKWNNNSTNEAILYSDIMFDVEKIRLD